jgi:hypothetical protein
VSASLISQLPRFWVGNLAHYGLHRNDEHCAALFGEAVRYSGLHLENDLAGSPYWSTMPLHQRAVRGLVNRTVRRGRRIFEPLPHAESWVAQQPSLQPYYQATIELLSALRHELKRRAHSQQA